MKEMEGEKTVRWKEDGDKKVKRPYGNFPLGNDWPIKED